MSQKVIFQKGFRLFFLLSLVFLISFVSGSFITPDRLAWYKTLPLSSLTPPDFVFSLVWTALYFMMAVSAFLVWNKASPRYFVLQLIANALWPFLFFYMHAPVMALIDIFVLLVLIFLTIKSFYPVSKVSGYLLMPLLAWCLFAFYLNGHIVYYLHF